MHYDDTQTKIAEVRGAIAGLRAQIRTLQAAIEPKAVADYTFAGHDGPVTLAQLFGAKDTLYVIHNMGASCPYCTMWADGFKSIYPYLASRAAFVIASPDAPAVQRALAVKRGWPMPMVSHAGTSFDGDMGYGPDAPRWPGVSVFQKPNGGVVRVADTEFGPGDDFCAVWHFLDLLPNGADGFEVRP